MSDVVRYTRTSLLSLIGVVVIGASLMAPWSFGCIHPGFHLGLITLIAIAAACWLPLLLTNQLPRVLSWWYLSPLLLVGAVCLLQVLELPQPVLQLASPGAVTIQRELVPASREIDAKGFAIPRTIWSSDRRMSLYPAETWKHTTWFFAIVVLFAVAQTTSTKETTHRLLLALTINGAVLAFIAIATFLSSDKSRVVTWEWNWGHYSFGNFLNRNHFAFYMNLCFGAGLGMWLSRYRELHAGGSKLANDWRLLLYSTALVTILTSLLVCQSRGGISSTLIAALALGAYFFRSADLHRAKIAVALVTVVIVFSYWVDESLLESRIAAFLFGGEVVDVSRVGLWQRLGKLVVQFPLFGAGVGTIPFIEPFTREVSIPQIVKYAHNDYLQLLIEIGVVGFAGFTLFVCRIGHCARYVKQTFSSSENSSHSVGILFALAAAAFHSIVDFSMRMPGVAAVVLILAACLVAVTKFPNQSIGKSNLHSVWLRAVVAVGVGFAMCVSVQHMSALKTATDRVAAFDASIESDPNRTRLLTEAVSIYPARADWQLLLAEHLAEGDAADSDRFVVIQHHAVAARDLCPMFSYAQADLAQLSYSFTSADPAESYLRRAQISHPSSDSLFYLSGNQRMHVNDKVSAIRYWRKSLSLSGTHLHDILLALAEIPDCTEAELESVVPDDADRLYQASQITQRAKQPLLASESLRVAWLRRCWEQLQSLASTTENRNQIYRRAQIAASMGQVDQAIEDFEIAVSLAPNQKAWRFQFAKYLVSANRIHDAQGHLRRLVRMAEHKQAETLLKQISSSGVQSSS